MEAISQTCYLSPSTQQTIALVNKIPVKRSLNIKKQRWVSEARCGASRSRYVAAVEPITPEEEEELTQGRRICGGEAKRGLWELLECLEKEAIMGSDDGRDPIDYQRRAKIFDKSSKLFKNSRDKA